MNGFFKMTGFLTVATAVVGAVLIASAPTKAQSTMRVTCHGTSKQKVEHCCDAWIKQNGRPFLLFGSRSSCGGVVACAAAAPKLKTLTSAIVIPPKKIIDCKIKAPADFSDGGNHSSHNPPPAPPAPPVEQEVPR